MCCIESIDKMLHFEGFSDERARSIAHWAQLYGLYDRNAFSV